MSERRTKRGTKSNVPGTRCRRALASALVAAAVALCGCRETADVNGKTDAAKTPAQVAAAADWCAGHGVPESKCTVCNPGLIPKFKEAGDWCAEHGYPESVCPVCNPLAPPADSDAPLAAGTRIRFRSPEIERDAGITVVKARAAALAVAVECTARIEFDANRVAEVRAPIPGVVRELLVDPGERVEKDAPLFALESAQIGELRGRLRAERGRVDTARAHHARQKELRAANIASERQLETAARELAAAEADLRSIEASLRLAEAPEGGEGGRYLLQAPISGTVIRRPARLGTFATEETLLAMLADTSVVWAVLDVREADAAGLQVGQETEVRVDGLPGRTFSGQVTWIASEVDPRTRTVAARAEIANRDGVLRAHQFARAAVRIAPAENAVAVPRRAVQRLEDEQVVFVRTAAGLYEPRLVTLGRSSGEEVHVTGKVQEGDLVVTDGAFLLKTELSKDSIGAGCCEVAPPGEK